MTSSWWSKGSKHFGKRLVNVKKRVLEIDFNFHHDYLRGWQNALLTLSLPQIPTFRHWKSHCWHWFPSSGILATRETQQKNTEQGKINLTRINAFSQVLRQTWRIEYDEKYELGSIEWKIGFENYFMQVLMPFIAELATHPATFVSSVAIH